jgi:hypothetical protein
MGVSTAPYQEHVECEIVSVGSPETGTDPLHYQIVQRSTEYKYYVRRPWQSVLHVFRRYESSVGTLAGATSFGTSTEAGTGRGLEASTECWDKFFWDDISHFSQGLAILIPRGRSKT